MGENATALLRGYLKEEESGTLNQFLLNAAVR